MSFAAPSSVLVRDVSARYASCIRVPSRSRDAPIDLELARAQHARYVDTIAALGIEVVRLPSLDDDPDAVFVEDTAVVLERSALITRPGASSRRRETASVALALGGAMLLHEMSEPATLDGGDVLRVGARLFVGLSHATGARTNRTGFDVLTQHARAEGLETVEVPVAAGLHLKSGCTIADPETILLHPASVDAAPFVAAGLRIVEVDEPEGANVLALGWTVLASTAAPRSIARLRALGFDVRPLDVSEIHKGDGALTCLSVRLPGAGHWAT